MVLYLIGLGLGDERDVTVKGLEIIKSSDYIYLEHYTAILGIEPKKLEEFYAKQVILADREFVESNSSSFLSQSLTHNVSFLVVGDPLGATTHTDLMLRAIQLGVKVEIIHNASIINAIGCVGLQLYNYGQIISIPFFTPNWQPDSFYNKIAVNLKNNFHTLCLLDIKVKEQTPENIAKNIQVYEKPRYMTVNQAIQQLLLIESIKQENIITNTSPAYGVARIGQKDQVIISGSLSELLNRDFGSPLHSLVIPAKQAMHELEWDMYEHYHWDSVNRSKIREQEKKEKEAQNLAEFNERQKLENERRLKVAADRQAKLTAEAEGKKKAAEDKLAAENQKNNDKGEEETVEIEPLF